MPQIHGFKTSLLVLALTGNAATVNAATRCEDLFTNNRFEKVAPRAVAPSTIRPAQMSWVESVNALKQIDQAVYGRSQVIEALTTAILAKEFVWINGIPMPE